MDQQKYNDQKQDVAPEGTSGNTAAKLSATAMLWRALGYLLLSLVEDVLFVAKIMFSTVATSALVWLFLDVSNLFPTSLYLVWLGTSSVMAISYLIRR